MFNFLTEKSPGKNQVWDCACGTGQVSKSMVKHFKKIKASDINDNQIKSAYQNKKIEYSIQNSENTTYKDESFDLVCVAQALHWFSTDKYFQEVNRILKNNGIFACFGYSFFKINDEIDQIIKETIFDPILPYWAEENKLLWNNYTDINFPFTKINTPKIEMYEYWDKLQLMGYIKTWSAYKRFKKENSDDIINNFLDKISEIWEENCRKKVIMDFTFYCGRKK